MVNIEQELAASRKKLLDLTMRNRLLNFRPTKARTIRIIDEIPTEIYNILVLNEKTMDFLPKKEYSSTSTDNSQSLNNSTENGDMGFSQQEKSILWKLPTPDKKLDDHHIDRFLQTNLDDENLQKRLFLIAQDAKSIMEEIGYSILYLAMSFLQYTESSSSNQIRQAPLILIPVELERRGINSAFKVRYNGNDISTNISLQSYLNTQGVFLPDFKNPEEKSGIDAYLHEVSNIISNKPNWHISNDIYIGFFSFRKFIMYKDLDPTAWPEGKSPAEHHLIREIISPSGQHISDSCEFRECELDNRVSFRDLYQVMDADSSQLAVIEKVKKGLNLVVEGPPGTGKSQTITNIIAELLSISKTVLFVSDKMAALKVVKDRLDTVGLGPFCLELHSEKMKHKEFVKELDQTINQSPPQAIALEDDFTQWENLRSQLNDYVAELKEPFGELALSPFTLFGIKEKSQRYYETVNRSMPRIYFKEPHNWSKQQLIEANQRLHELQNVLSIVKPITKHPWYGCHPGIILPSDQNEIVDLIDDCTRTTDTLESYLNKLIQLSGIASFDRLRSLASAIEAARIIAISDAKDRYVLENTEWNEPNQKASELIQKVEAFVESLSVSTKIFNKEALDCNIDSILSEYRALSNKFLHVLNGRYRSLKKQIASLYKSPMPKSNKSVLASLKQLVACIKLREEVRQADSIGRSLFGSHWCSEHSDPNKLKAFANWIVSFRQQLMSRALTEDSVELLTKGISRHQVEQAIQAVEKTSTDFITTRDSLANRIGLNYKETFNADADDVSFSTWKSRLQLWKTEISRLQSFSQYESVLKKCSKTVAAPLSQALETATIEPEDVIPCFEGNLADNLLSSIFSVRPCLSGFIGSIHESKIKDFADIDRMLIRKNRHRVVSTLYQNRPHITGGASPNSEHGILMREIQRKRSGMKIRQLMSTIGGLITQIKPCFMMSPLSVAQFLDPKMTQFDVIIFDEASQVRPEDAIGAILRGRQIVVMGDTRQLPPTSFFDRMINEDNYNEEDNIASISSMESILHQCKVAFPGDNDLKWHYRSRHESLIAVSNQEFYDNRLLIYPSPINRSSDLGLQFKYLPDSVYDRGRSQVNRNEAKAVIEAAIEHYRNFPEKSLGIGTFNTKQQEAIYEECELQLKLHPEMEGFFKDDRKEHFFVKNLETIQGDERDAIFISIGFGFDEFRRLYHTFGPLNQDGGERRLNVLITRAREKCIVFSNFKSTDLTIDSSSSRGLRALKTFLAYAENKILISTNAGVGTESPFEDSVYDYLSSYGFQVHKQVGCASFRIDLAIVDPKNPGTYILGIECDGAKYHSAPTARDRDRLRQQVLVNLGWRIYHIWSTDWYRNRATAIQKLIYAINNAIDEGPMKFGTTTETYTSPVEPHLIVDNPRIDSDSEGTYTELLEDSIPEYEICSSMPESVSINGEIHDFPQNSLALIIAHIVNIEGPIHIDEVIRRIRTLWRKGRAGDRMRNTIINAADVAQLNQTIRIQSKFLWPYQSRPVVVRRRSIDPPPNIDFICDEEISEAIKLVLQHQSSTVANDLATRSSRLLGIQATRADTAKRIHSVIDKMLNKGELEKLPNGMVGIKNQSN